MFREVRSGTTSYSLNAFIWEVPGVQEAVRLFKFYFHPIQSDHSPSKHELDSREVVTLFLTEFRLP